MALTEEGIIHIPGVMSRWVRLASGARAHYLTSGDTGPAVVLCHGGLPGSSGGAGWRYQLPFLGERGFRVYAPDFPGFGLADTSPAFWPVLGPLSHLEFLHQFADALGLERFHLAGNSMGCGNSWRYAVSHPERVISFILIAGNIPGYVDPGRIVRTIDVRRLNRETFDGTKESMRAMMEPIIHRKEAITDELLEMRVRSAVMQREALRAYHRGSDRVEADPNLRQAVQAPGRLERLTIPRILLWGKNDVLNPVENCYLQEDVTPHIQYFYPEECGHQGQTDQPELFNQVFLEFFRDGKVSRQTADRAGVSKRKPEDPAVVEQATGAKV